MSNVDGSGQFFHIKERVTHRNHLGMIVYGIGIILLIFELLSVHPKFTQPWYADSEGAKEKFGDLQKNMRDILMCVPPRG